MAIEFVAYIDEAGDEGFGKLTNTDSGGQSRWLVLGCCMVRRQDDLKLPAGRDQILARFPKRRTRDLHFRDLKHAQKVVACQEIAKFPIITALMCSHKITIPGSKWEKTFKQKGYLYNYLLRWLLERLTTHCTTLAGGKQCSLKIVFSRRANTDYASMMDYLILMRDGREQIKPIRSINWKVLDVNNITVENHSKWAGLQLADCVTSAFFSALEPNIYGNYEHSYADLLRGTLIREGGNALNCGLSCVPSFFTQKLDKSQLAFIRSFMKE